MSAVLHSNTTVGWAAAAVATRKTHWCVKRRPLITLSIFYVTLGQTMCARQSPQSLRIYYIIVYVFWKPKKSVWRHFLSSPWLPPCLWHALKFQLLFVFGWHSTSLNRDISLVHPMQSEHNTGIAMGLHTGYISRILYVYIRTKHTHLISSNVRLAI